MKALNTENNVNTENNLQEEENEITIIKSRLLQLEKERHHLQQKIKGNKSGIARSKKGKELVYYT